MEPTPAAFPAGVDAARQLDRWTLSAAVLAVTTAGALALALSSSVVTCDAVLVRVPEPACWRAWPVEDGLGGFSIEGEPLMRKYNLGLFATELRDPGLCPRGGVSLDGWFASGPQPSMHRTRAEIRLRRAGDVWVASGQAMESASEDFVTAFTRRTGRRWALTSERAGALSFTLAAVLSILGRGLVVAGVARRRARTSLARAASGVGSYRVAASVAETGAETRLVHAASTVRSAAIAALVILVVAIVAGGCLQAMDDLRTLV
jgi:hypothetical protein